MKLSAYSSSPSAYHEIRDLTEQEFQTYEQFTPIFVEARNRLRVFRMLKINYDEWQSYVRSLLSAKAEDHDGEMLNLDRLLLNYLTCAYTIQKHFEVSFQTRFRRDEAKQQEYASFRKKLYEQCWAFAFFVDFRGFVQHYGLGIGRYNRNITKTSVSLRITCDSKILLEDTKDWKTSKLTAERGELDLVELLQEYHMQMFQSYGAFVAKMFFPELAEVAQFYENLTQEVKTHYPSMRMIFATPMKQTQEGSIFRIHIDQFVGVPNDVFAELGITTQPGVITADVAPAIHQKG